MPATSGEVTLARVECEKLWALVVREELRSFQPQKSEGQVFDFGERCLEIGFAEKKDVPLVRHSVSWEAPLTNESKVKALVRAMGQLAAKSIKQVQLFYFPAS